MKVYKVLCMPLAKSGWPEGRIGPLRWQNSEVIQRVGAELVLSGKAEKVLLISGFEPKESNHSDLYWMLMAAHRYGLNDNQIIQRKKGHDTKSQLEHGMVVALNGLYDKLTVVSSLIHFPRVWWLTFRMKHNFLWLKRTAPKMKLKIEHQIIIGIPRPAEFVTDFFGFFLTIGADLTGRSDKLDAFMKKRRASGKL